MAKRKKKTARKPVETKIKEREDGVDVTNTVTSLVPIAELLKHETSILGERSQGNLSKVTEFSPQFLDMATRLVAAGFTEQDLAYVIGCSPAKIKQWKRRYPLFKAACTNGKKVALSYLVACGLRSAAGYDTVEKNIKVRKKWTTDENGKEILVEFPSEISEFHKHHEPNASLLMFMLCNMSRQLKEETPWASTHKIEIDETKNVNIKLSRATEEQIGRLAGAFAPENIIDAEVVDAKSDKKPREPRRLPTSDTKNDTGESGVQEDAAQ
jgi:hypothetical protein